MMSGLTKTLALAALAALDRIRKVKIRAENLLGSVDTAFFAVMRYSNNNERGASHFGKCIKWKVDH